jgi:hypothetical protein
VVRRESMQSGHREEKRRLVKGKGEVVVGDG